ncbi:MAG: hypothetical protein R3C10_25630 [Pirellulales bacterium]
MILTLGYLTPLGRFAGGSGVVSRATGFEDLFQQFDTVPNNYPGYLESQLSSGFEQYAARITIDTLPLPGDGNGRVDGLDYLLWAGAYGTSRHRWGHLKRRLQRRRLGRRAGLPAMGRGVRQPLRYFGARADNAVRARDWSLACRPGE